MIVPLSVMALFGVLATTLVLSRKRIPEGKVYTLRRRHESRPELLTAGTHWIVPLRDHIAHKISLTGRTLRVDETLPDTRHMQGAIYWQVIDPKAADAVIERAESLIRQHLAERLTDTVDVIALKRCLNDAMRHHGLLITRVDLRVVASVPAAA